jgi:FtsH-binding integral membrane protein
LSRLFGSAVLDVLVSWCGAAVFSVHIMYDTRRLATMRNGCDCASRAFELYLSTMVVFLDILALAEAA